MVSPSKNRDFTDKDVDLKLQKWWSNWENGDFSVKDVDSNHEQIMEHGNSRCFEQQTLGFNPK